MNEENKIRIEEGCDSMELKYTDKGWVPTLKQRIIDYLYGFIK